MEEYKLQTCCWCTSLKNGCYIIGVLEALTFIAVLVPNEKSEDRYINLIERIMEPEFANNSLGGYIAYMGLSFMFFCVAILLIYGAYKEIKILILPWICLCAFKLALFLLLFIAAFLNLVTTLKIRIYMPPTIGMFLTSAFTAYYLAVVVSFYADLEGPPMRHNQRSVQPA